MANPIRWLFFRRRRLLAAAAPDTASRFDRTQPTDLAPLIEGLCGSVDAFRADLRELRDDAAQRQLDLAKELVETLREMGGALSRLENAVAGRLADVGAEVGRLREAVDVKFGELEAITGTHNNETHQLCARTESLAQGVSRLAGNGERQLEVAEKALESLRSTSEAAFTELRTSHARHVEGLERSREEVLVAAQRSRDHVSRHVEEVADFLERELWPAVPTAELESLPAAERVRRPWLHPVRALRSVTRRNAVRRARADGLEHRTAQLEDLLRERWNACRLRGHELRAVLLEEESAATSIARDDTRARPRFEPLDGAADAVRRQVQGMTTNGRRHQPSGGTNGVESADARQARNLALAS